MLEVTGEPRVQAGASVAQSTPTPVSIEVYRPGEVRLGVQSPSAGLVVLKDIYAPGWQARVDGQPTRILRVDGLVRGVAIGDAGQHEVVFEYQPEPFVRGVWLSLVTAALLLASVGAAYLIQRRRGQRCAWKAHGCSARSA
jgi:uncharacterized membrane protein YfhO